MKRTRQIYDAFMRAVKEGSIPFGYYGPRLVDGQHPTRCAASASKTVLWCI
jgi:hypothetical protein